MELIKKNYTAPKLEFFTVRQKDVIATSGGSYERMNTQQDLYSNE